MDLKDESDNAAHGFNRMRRSGDFGMRRRFPATAPLLYCLAFLIAGCSGGGSAPPVSQASLEVAHRTLQLPETAAPPAADARLKFESGFYAKVIAHVGTAREIAALPDGDILVGTSGKSISIVPNADGPGVAGAPRTFITLPEGPAESVVYAPNGSIYAGTNTHVWKIAYKRGDLSESSAVSIARVRTGPIAPHSDGDVHTSTSVAVSATKVYASVGSSCNACVEVDPTRAAVLVMGLGGSNVTRLAQRARNPIAVAIDPPTGNLWIGGAGQDSLPYTHPYEYFDSPTVRGASNIDYGWPQCEENRKAYNELKVKPAPSCAKTVVPEIEFPAYATLVGAAFYHASQKGPYAFPIGYRSGVYVTAHGSWHCCPSTPPRVFYVATAGDKPEKPIDWANPSAQSVQFVSGYGTSASNSYIGRPTGVAVGANGSLFVADNGNGAIMRIRYK